MLFTPNKLHRHQYLSIHFDGIQFSTLNSHLSERTMGNCCFPQGTSDDSVAKSSDKSACTGNSRLARASKATLEHFLTQEERTEILANPSISIPLRLLLNAPFCTFSAFSQNIYLTGIGGVTIENLKQFNIKCLVNVAEEIPSVPRGNQHSSLICHKFPFVDNYTFQVGSHLDKVVNAMHSALKEKDGNCVVYCTAGMSRSSTVVLAYAIKHMHKSLKEAFDSLQDARNCARPNLSFFKQLVSFEKKCRQTNSVRMVQEPMNMAADAKKKKKRGAGAEPTIEVPNFYRKEYPQLFKLEVNEALAGNCPMVKGMSGSANSVGSSMAASSSAASQATESKVASKLGDQDQGQVYTTHELKPFVLDDVSYKDLLAELRKLRTRKPKQKNDSNSAPSRPSASKS